MTSLGKGYVVGCEEKNEAHTRENRGNFQGVSFDSFSSRFHYSMSLKEIDRNQGN